MGQQRRDLVTQQTCTKISMLLFRPHPQLSLFIIFKAVSLPISHLTVMTDLKTSSFLCFLSQVSLGTLTPSLKQSQ